MHPDELLKLANDFENEVTEPDGIAIDDIMDSKWKGTEVKNLRGLIKIQLDEIAKIRGTLLNKLRTADVYELNGMNEALRTGIEEMKWAL